MGSKSLVQQRLCPEKQCIIIVTCWFRAAVNNSLSAKEDIYLFQATGQAGLKQTDPFFH